MSLWLIKTFKEWVLPSNLQRMQRQGKIGFEDEKLVWSSGAKHTWSSGKFTGEFG